MKIVAGAAIELPAISLIFFVILFVCRNSYYCWDGGTLLQHSKYVSYLGVIGSLRAVATIVRQLRRRHFTGDNESSGHIRKFT